MPIAVRIVDQAVVGNTRTERASECQIRSCSSTHGPKSLFRSYSTLTLQFSHSHSSCHVGEGASPNHVDPISNSQVGPASNSPALILREAAVCVRGYTLTPDLMAPHPGNQATMEAVGGLHMNDATALGSHKGDVILLE